MTLRAALGLAAAAVVAAAGTLRMDTRRDVVVQESRDPALRMRASSPLLVPMFNLVVQYRVNVSIGTPPQDLTLAVDTGSSDVWIPDATACGLTSKSACAGGYFTPASSSTFKDIASGFDIEYVDRTSSKGDYISDVLTVNGVKLDNFTMGLALTTTVDIGLLGIGFPNNEAGVATDEVQLHPTFVTALVAAGDISSAAYSLWLDDLLDAFTRPSNAVSAEASQGSILFGGIDTAKYSGTLALIDLYPSAGNAQITEFLVALTSVSATSSSGTDQLTPSGYAVGVVLDSGTTLTYVPQDLATVIFNEVGATYNSTLGIATVPCSLANKGGSINFGFGGHSGPQISVAMSQLVDPAKLEGEYLTDSNGKVVCRFGITLQPRSDSDSSLLFGDTFLRSAYVVYDLVNNQIGLAQTQFNATASNVVAFASSGAPIPSATVAPGAADVAAATASTVATTQSLSASKGFQSAAARGLLPLGLWELVMFTFGVLLFTRLLGPRP